jgi:hypothetical protein
MAVVILTDMTAHPIRYQNLPALKPDGTPLHKESVDLFADRSGRRRRLARERKRLIERHLRIYWFSHPGEGIIGINVMHFAQEMA